METASYSHDDITLLQAQSERGQPISQILMKQGKVSASDVVHSMAESQRIGQPLTHIMAAEGLVSREDILAVQARHYGALVLRREITAPDPELARLLTAELCLEHGVLPWAQLGEKIVIATARPDEFDGLKTLLPRSLQNAVMALTLEADIHDEIAALYGAEFVHQAETCIPKHESCRDIDSPSPRTVIIAGLLATIVLVLFVYQPLVLFGTGLVLAIGSLLLAQGLKLVALFASARPKRPAVPRLPDQLPTVSILIPLFRESEIADRLIQRLSRLTYPKSCLDVQLILEADDTKTRALLKKNLSRPGSVSSLSLREA